MKINLQARVIFYKNEGDSFQTYCFAQKLLKDGSSIWH